jgi:16S rRNA (guanine(966)-N(2))-methyltransferase RsmD
MRVIGGSARGRQLASFGGRDIRPTPDRVREALFSIIFSRRGSFAGVKVLDLFAGSGALGIEALSRGGAHAWFVDSSRQSMAVIRENLERCKLSNQATMIVRDIWAALPVVAGNGPFDLIFADPPYGGELATRLLKESCLPALLAPSGLFCLETAVSDQVPVQVGTLHLLDQRRYGLTMLHFYHLAHEDQV